MQEFWAVTGELPAGSSCEHAGHSRDHVVFHEPESGSLFTGDAVLGRGTSVIDPPEGDMAQKGRVTLSCITPGVPDHPANMDIGLY